MVVSQTEFRNALNEINNSYAKIIARIEELEKLVAEMNASKRQVKSNAA